MIYRVALPQNFSRDFIQGDFLGDQLFVGIELHLNDVDNIAQLLDEPFDDLVGRESRNNEHTDPLDRTFRDFQALDVDFAAQVKPRDAVQYTDLILRESDDDIFLFHNFTLCT